MHSNSASTEVPNSPESVSAPPEATEDLLVEEVSIDGMCGVY